MASPTDDKTRQLVLTMRNYRLPDWTVERSVEGLYTGFSLSMSGYTIFAGALLLIAIAGADTKALRRLAMVMVLGMAVLTVVSMIYFILPPTTFLLLSLLLAAASLLRA
ncbi:MAG: hypothetical protein HY820_15565 [Acidobacteria bacterium]|nr:hypothetical protein [Acidobacteriota bacterium]